MTPTELTALLSSISAFCAAVGVPLYLQSRKAKQDDAVSVAGVATMYREERDSLQSQIKEIRAECDRRLADMEAKYQAQIVKMQEEIDGLYRRLFHHP